MKKTLLILAMLLVVGSAGYQMAEARGGGGQYGPGYDGGFGQHGPGHDHGSGFDHPGRGHGPGHGCGRNGGHGRCSGPHCAALDKETL